MSTEQRVNRVNRREAVKTVVRIHRQPQDMVGGRVSPKRVDY